MARPDWITQEDMYLLNNSKKAWDWMFHDYLVFRFAGKYTKKEIMRKLRINRFQYHRLTVRMNSYLIANSEPIECANLDV